MLFNIINLIAYKHTPSHAIFLIKYISYYKTQSHNYRQTKSEGTKFSLNIILINNHRPTNDYG